MHEWVLKIFSQFTNGLRKYKMERFMWKPYKEQCFQSQVPFLHSKNPFKTTLCSSSSFTNTMICLYISFFALPFHSFHYLLLHFITSILSTPFTTHPWINYFIVPWELHTSMVHLIFVNNGDSSMHIDWKILQVNRLQKIHSYLSRCTKVL